VRRLADVVEAGEQVLVQALLPEAPQHLYVVRTLTPAARAAF
jgi:hypothetical protein